MKAQKILQPLERLSLMVRVSLEAVAEGGAVTRSHSCSSLGDAFDADSFQLEAEESSSEEAVHEWEMYEPPEEPPEVSGTLLFACGEVPASEEADAVDPALEAKRRERRQRFNTRPETAPPA